METISIIISFLSLCVAGYALIQTHKSNKFTQKLEQARRKDEIERMERETTKNRPQLKITSYKNNCTNPGYIQDDSFDIDVIFVPYKELDCDMDNYTAFNTFEHNTGKQGFTGKKGIRKKPFCKFIDIYNKKDEWVSFEFELENIGNSSIQTYFLLSNMEKHGGLFDVKSRVIEDIMAVGGCEYCVSGFNDIYKGDKIKVKINFHKDYIIKSVINAPFYIYMETEFDEYWRQYLFLREDGTEQSHPTNYEEYYKYLHGDYLDAVMYDRVYWDKHKAQQKRIERKLEKSKQE